MLDDTIEIEEMMREVFEQMRRDIIARHEQAGQVASGRTRDSLRSEIVPGMSSVTATLYGRKYFAALETGSKPWAKQYQHPPKPFVETIAEWMKDKGITGVSAYLVARKIMQEGSSLYRSGGRNDIFTPAMQDAERKIDEQISALFERITTGTIAKI
jgi:hypothetical protein